MSAREDQPRDTNVAVMLLIKAARLNRYTVQAMRTAPGKDMDLNTIARYEVIRCRDGKLHAVVEVLPSGGLRCAFVHGEAIELGEQREPDSADLEFAAELEAEYRRGAA